MKFKYFVVLDFEATCEADKSKQSPQEIIEFPSVLVEAATGDIIATFQQYVRPVKKPTLSTFCTDLTGITQDTVERARPFGEVLADYRKWLTNLGLDPDFVPPTPTDGDNEDTATEHPFTVITDGAWDLMTMLPTQLSHETDEVRANCPKCLTSFVNMKPVFEKTTGETSRVSPSIEAQLTFFGLQHQGRLHSGIDDCSNMAAILSEIIKRGGTQHMTLVDTKQPCPHCNNVGHDPRDCPSKPVKCYVCGESGHFMRDCPKRSEESCFSCGQKGHFARDCRNPSSHTYQKPAGAGCRNCGAIGHFARDCPRPGGEACRVCGERGHYARFCPKNVDGAAEACHICHQTGHFARECPRRETEGSICHLCGNRGHFARECPRAAAGSNSCYHCGRVGHFARDCPRAPANNCHNCGRPGHFARECTARAPMMLQQGAGGRGGGTHMMMPPANRGRGGYVGGNDTCHACGGRGHFARDCPRGGRGGPEPMIGICNACGMRGHMARDCTRGGGGMHHHHHHHHHQQQQRGGRGGMMMPQAAAGPRCHVCSMPGHFARDCPRGGRGGGVGVGSGGPTCHLCHQPGHFARECPRRVM
eukprot:PhM_4_TR18736/c0_g1_i2/m.65805